VDVDRIKELRTWAQRLEERASNEETRAAAKAILMLADEVEDLRGKLDAAGAEAPAAVAEPATAADAARAETETETAPAWEAADDRLSGSFVSRLKRTFGFQ
jgi:hypothetical protein